MKEYGQAALIVIGGLVALGIILLFAPALVALASVLWPLLLVPILIIVVAEYLKRRG